MDQFYLTSKGRAGMFYLLKSASVEVVTRIFARACCYGGRYFVVQRRGNRN